MTPVSHLLYPDAPIGPHAGLCALCGYDGGGQYSRDILDLATSNITALFECIEEISANTVFIEVGKEALADYLCLCRVFKYSTFYNSTYYRKRENKCYVIHATNAASRRRYKQLEDMDEEAIIQWICANHDYACIGDLCMGRGLVGRYAFAAGKRFVGTELNPKRLAVLVDWVKGKSGR